MANPSLTERTALKEWSVLVDATVRGDVIAIVRKGGIREQRAGFAVRHERFLFYPTFFHEKVNELAAQLVPRLEESHARRPDPGTVRIEYVADVVGTWAVTDLETLRSIGAEHGLAWNAVESRFYYKNTHGVHVVALRVSRLPAAAIIPEINRYQGCVSWVELDDGIDVSGAIPVLDEATLAMRVAALRNTLG